MKKFLFCMTALLMFAMAAVASETKAFTPPGDTDIGCVMEQQVCANISLDGLTFTVTNNNIVAWQAPVMLNMEVSATSAQVIDEISTLTPMGEFRMTLVCYRWPKNKSQMNSCTSHYNAPSADAYSFTAQRTDFI